MVDREFPPTGMLLAHAAAGQLVELARLWPGVSVPRLAQEAVRLSRDPRVAVEYPRQVRQIRERLERLEAAREHPGMRVEGV